jgi:hypothetical protein
MPAVYSVRPKEGYTLKKLLLGLVAASVFSVATSVPASANHSWGGYHWARTSNPFTISLGENLSASWDPYLVAAAGDWSASDVLDAAVVRGRSRYCRAIPGRVEVCSRYYGQTGWLGVASISITGGTHITQGTVRVNDTYFVWPQYDNSAERLHVVCQEVGHTFGLDHQSESGESLNTCMDYYNNTSSADTQSTRPNQHDYEELATIYAHSDSFTTIGSATAEVMPEWTPEAWRASRYVDVLANGDIMVTYVIWENPVHPWR